MRELTEELVTTVDEQVRARVIRILDTFTCGVLAESQRRIVFANEKFAKMVGTEREKLWGMPTHELVPHELRDVFHDEIGLAEKGDLRARLTALYQSDGTTSPILLLPMAFFESQAHDGGIFRFDLIIDLGSVMTAKHMLYDGQEKLRGSLTRIAVDLQVASLLAGNVPAANPELHHPDLADLSKREREVLALLVEGQRVPSIAQQLFISQHTVRNHLKSIFRKLGVGSQTELIDRVREIR